MPPLRGDLPETFLFRKLGHAYELYPLLFLVTVAWTSALAFVIYVSIIKIELRWDHSEFSYYQGIGGEFSPKFGATWDKFY